MQLGHGNSRNNTLDLLTGDDIKDEGNGDGWGDDDDFEDWGSLEEGRSIILLIIVCLVYLIITRRLVVML